MKALLNSKQCFFVYSIPLMGVERVNNYYLS